MTVLDNMSDCNMNLFCRFDDHRGVQLHQTNRDGWGVNQHGDPSTFGQPTYAQLRQVDLSAFATTGAHNNVHARNRDDVTTKIPTKWLMITWVEDVQQHRLRTGNQVINMFNRGYMYPQQQIESGCNLRFTTFELASQQIWEINADGGNTMLQQICNYFQWNKDWMWTYNIPVQVSNMNVESTQQEKRLVLQCLEYGGAQMLHHFTTSTRDAVMEMLQQMHSTSITSGINTGNILFQGAKTVERIRGNSHLATWVEQQWTEEMINNHFKEINVWRLSNLPLTMPKDEIQQLLRENCATTDDDQQMEG